MGASRSGRKKQSELAVRVQVPGQRNQLLAGSAARGLQPRGWSRAQH